LNLRAVDWAEIEAAKFPLIVSVPEARAWQIDRGEKNWLLLHHAPSHSSLFVRVWRAARTVTPDSCRAQAALWQPVIGEVGEDQRVSEQRLQVPLGFDTAVEALVIGLSGTPHSAAGPPEPVEVEGRVHAFGAAPGRCFAVLFVTRSRGTGAERVVAERMSLMADEALPRMRMRGIEDRVRIEPAAPGPAGGFNLSPP